MVPVLEPAPGTKVWDQMGVRWTFTVALIGLAALLGGCADTLPLAKLPDFYKLPEKVLSKDEQQGKVNEMMEKGQSHQAEAAKQIEKDK